jgi:hypothetical protein
MPFDSMLVSAAVIAVFVGFAVVLIWLIFKRDRHGSGSMCILKGAEAFEATADMAG